MRRLVKTLGMIAALMAGPAAAMAAAPAPVAVTGGTVSGVAYADIVHYFGIPFAAPPVGALRWRPPQPVRPWTGTRLADKFGNDCMQNPLPGSYGAFPEPRRSEDCLYLNIWEPASAKAGARLPVMVWVYGGGFQIGSSAIPLYNGSDFAADGVVLVSFNYRLNKFGFFAHPALAKEDPEGAPLGNYGILDQIAALKWVRANIAKFGGDPDNVTIFGESAGAMSVQYLMTSPLAKGLFERAIVESGFARFHLQSFAEAEARGKAAARGWGVSGDNAAALRRVPAKTVLGDTTMSRDAFWPMVDGRIIPGQTMTLFEAGKIAHVPWIVGSNSYELGLFPTLAKMLAPQVERVWPQVATLYDGFGTRDHTVMETQVATDMMLTEPTRAIAREAAHDGMPTYVYFYSYVNPTLRKHYPGAPHFFEVPAVFDTMNLIEPNPEPATAKVVAAMHSRWVAFAKTGKPGRWPEFKSNDQEALEFSAQGPIVRKNLLAPRLDFVDRMLAAGAK